MTGLHRRRRKNSQLATSFVITVGAIAASSATSGCKKQGVDNDPEETSSIRQDYDGTCLLRHPEHCPKGASCNPPPPTRIDCPPDLRDAAANAEPPITRRPPGKADWLRVTPELYTISDKECVYQPETFCPPPSSKSKQCTVSVQVKVACRMDADAGTRSAESFVYKDGVGACRRVPASECKSGRRGACPVPEGDVVPCT